MSLPDDPAEAVARWRGAVNEAVTKWHRARGCDFPDLNDLDRRGVIDPIGFCVPHYFILPTYSSASSYRIRPLGPEQTLFEIWSLTRYPGDRSPGKPTPPEPLTPDDPELADDPGAGLLQPAASAERPARQGIRLHAAVDMRRRYSGDQPNEGKWSIANAGDTGEVLQTAMSLGAKTDLLDEAWWLPSVFIVDGGKAAKSLRSGRQRPGSDLRRLDRSPILQRVQLVRRGRQGDVRQQGGAVLDGVRRRLRRQVRFGRQPTEKAPPARGTDRARSRHAWRHHQRPRTPNRRSR
jgi:hypothetical protein